MKLNLLAIDTSTERATVAITAHGEMHSEEQTNLRQHAQCLLPMIDSLLTKAKLTLNQLDGIVFGCGPGSFTGLRITCSIAKALAYAHDLPLFPVSGLQAIAQDVYQSETDLDEGVGVLAMLDARMHEVYWAYFDRHMIPSQHSDRSFEKAVSYVSPASDIVLSESVIVSASLTSPYDQSSKSLANDAETMTEAVLSVDAPLILAGVGLDIYAQQLPQAVQARIMKQRAIFPNAEAMIRLAQTGKIHSVSAADALPIYVRNQVTQGEKRG